MNAWYEIAINDHDRNTLTALERICAQASSRKPAPSRLLSLADLFIRFGVSLKAYATHQARPTACA